MKSNDLFFACSNPVYLLMPNPAEVIASGYASFLRLSIHVLSSQSSDVNLPNRHLMKSFTVLTYVVMWPSG